MPMGEDVLAVRTEAFLKHLIEGNTISSACRHMGISRSTYYDWRQKSSDFRIKAEKAILLQVTVVEDALYKSAVGGHIVAQIFYLCNRRSDRWKHVSNIEHHIIPPDAMRPSPALESMPLEDLKALRSIANRAHGVADQEIIDTNATVIQPGDNGKQNGNGSNGSGPPQES